MSLTLKFFISSQEFRNYKDTKVYTDASNLIFIGRVDGPAIGLHNKIEFISFSITAHVIKLLMMMINKVRDQLRKYSVAANKRYY